MKGWVLTLAPIALAAGAYWYFESDQCSERAAYAALQKEMAQHLKAPSTAIYQPWDDIADRPLDACIFNIAGYVESQNNFGAMRKSTFKGQIIGGEVFITAINGRLPGF